MAGTIVCLAIDLKRIRLSISKNMCVCDARKSAAPANPFAAMDAVPQEYARAGDTPLARRQARY